MMLLALWCSSIFCIMVSRVLNFAYISNAIDIGPLIFEYVPRIRIRVENRNRIRAQPVNYVGINLGTQAVFGSTV